MNYGKDLCRKGELNKVDQMEKLAKKLIGKKDMGMAFVTEGFYGYDGIGIIPNKPELIKYEGYVLFNEQLNKPEFFHDDMETEWFDA